MPARIPARSIHVLVAFLLILAILPTPANAADPMPRMSPGAPVMALYMAGAPPDEMATTAPTAAAAKSVSIVNTAMTPAASLNPAITLGTFTPAVDMTFLSDGVAVYWVVSDNAAAWTEIQANILEGSTVVVSAAASPVPPPTVTAETPADAATVSQIRIPIPLAGIELKGGTTYTLITRTSGVGASLNVLYDAVDRPSGLFAAISDGAAFATSSSAFNVFLAKDRTLTTELPTATTDESTPLPTDCTGACMGGQAPVNWGTWTATSDATVAGETILTLWVGAANVAAVRGMNSNLVIGGTTYAGQSWLATTAQAYGPSPGTPERLYRFTYATRGAEITAGDDITISFGMWSTTDLPTGTLNLLYGSAAKPAGVMIPIVGGPAASGPIASPQLIYESVTAAVLDVQHEFATPTNAVYHYNWTSALTAAVATYATNMTNGSVSILAMDGANATVLDAQLTATFNQTQMVNATTPGNWTITLSFANFTGSFSLGITSEAAFENGTSPAAGVETGDGTGLDANGDGDDKGKGAPGAGIGLLIAALAAIVLVRRRQA